ncbi:MAG TPA: enoyl-CoA hydratase/isomerase family protein [Burkholderiales bacterium]|jgi:methylglutaconyl-CoA hydratase|nr:enoyl-CoA hydratase/isomerase family protein [Burkholderiales bacterium]
MSEILLVQKRDGVAFVTLNRPQIRNAFDEALIAELAAALVELDADAAVRAVVLGGAGTAFCAGADLNWMKRMAGYGYEQNLADARALAAMLKTLERMAKPTIARVHGPAFAGGVGLVAACDIAVGTPDAKFCLSEAKLGLSPATISPYVVRAMGERIARRYFLTAEVFDANEAYRIGLLSMVSASEKLDADIGEILKHLTQGGPQALAKIKDLIRLVSSGAVDDAMIDDTAQRIAEIRVSPEGKEGIASFLEKRKPAWIPGKS